MVFKGKDLSEKNFDVKVNYVVDEFLVQGAITLIYAPPKRGKSSFAMGLCKHLMESTKLYPLYLDFDNPIVALEDRGINRVIKEYSGRFDYIHPDEICMSSFEALNALVKDATQNDYSDVVLFFDSVADFVDIMSDSAVTGFVTKLKTLRRAGATIILLHHTNKNESGYKGSSVLKSGSDNVFSLSSESGTTLEDYILLVSESARFGKIRNTAFSLRRENWSIEKINYDDVHMPYHVREFIREVKRVLAKEKSLNQTKLLEALGKDKADKTSMELLSQYTNRYWNMNDNGKGKSKIYTLL